MGKIGNPDALYQPHPGDTMPKKVVVAMSGGVDSSVTAALLKKRDYEVIGITMQLWEYTKDTGGCCGVSAIEDARRVANILGIPHYVVNLGNVFRKKVIIDFCKEYSEGRTPNPCIRCNQYIKFDALLSKAKEMGAEFIATGHYARIQWDKNKKRYIIKKGIDVNKDQSYVLYTMTQEQLAHTLMPLGEFTKRETRAKAKELGLPVADKPDSQEICFISDNRYADFLQGCMPQMVNPGPILSKAGKVLGQHKGIMFYTIGQRKGLGISSEAPLYVIAINQRENAITVGRREEAYQDEAYADRLNYVAIEKLVNPLNVKAKIRYLHPECDASVAPANGNMIHMKFKEPQFAVTPGQSAVLYKDDMVIGGGIIARLSETSLLKANIA